MREAAERRGLVVEAPESINSDEGTELLRRFAPDLLWVCDYGQILSREALSIPPLGGINLHGSLLPRHRGAAPVHWAILRGDAMTGVSVIHMTPKLDGGPVLAVRETPIGSRETQPELETRLAQLGIEATLEALQKLSQWDRLSPIGLPQDSSLVTTAPRLKKEQSQLDWSQPAEILSRQIRAYQPWPGSSTILERQHGAPLRLLLEMAIPESIAAVSSEPGALLEANKQGLLVRAGDHSALRILRLRPEGKRSMDVSEFLNGTPVQPGDRLVSPSTSL